MKLKAPITPKTDNRQGCDLVLKRIDRAFVNEEWLKDFEFCNLDAWPMANSSIIRSCSASSGYLFCTKK